MTYSRSKKTTDTEKKLQSIKAQLYGKDAVTSSPISTTYKFKSEGESKINNRILANQPDTAYLKNDLIRIFVLATLAIGAQLALYFSFASK